MLASLDPHSTYIPSQETELSHSSLESGFEGVGIEYLIVQDTVQVISALQGGPSDLAGIMAGDRIIQAGGKELTGKVSNREVFQSLRGKQGTQVLIKVCRPGMVGAKDFLVTRARISSRSVEAAFLIPPATGYLKVSKFSDNTYQECRQELELLKKSGATSLILDLRDNPGGYLDRATKLADEFLEDNKLIVYTDGKAKKYDQQYFSTQGGIFTQTPLVVVVNEGSASASEILAGAIQDNDRGLIVGRRTFGKGLVQVPISLRDGSELRLTISRYYSPSGRCIQKPYKDKMGQYDEELSNRFEKGELFDPDSIPINPKEVYETVTGRKVFGGGGIIPDVFVPLDTLATNAFLFDLMRNNLLREFALETYKAQKTSFDLLKKRQSPTQFTLPQNLMQRFVDYTEAKKQKWPYSSQGHNTELYIHHLLKAYIARLIWGDNGYYQVLSQRDPMILTALRRMEDARKLFARSKSKS
jgi:carboxyl-terminal processing protease